MATSAWITHCAAPRWRVNAGARKGMARSGGRRVAATMSTTSAPATAKATVERVV